MGCVHIYCGDGKGKTTACIGLAVRQSGVKDAKVLFVQFSKCGDSSEVEVLKSIPAIEYRCVPQRFGFSWNMTNEQVQEATVLYSNLLEEALHDSEKYDLLVLDEVLSSCSNGFISEARLTEFLQNLPQNLEVALSGRNPSESLIETADYVSSIQKVKHPYDEGQPSRKGVEY